MKQRTCNKCGQTKDLTEFYKTGRKTDKNPDNRHYTCKDCTKARLKQAQSQSPERVRERHLQRVYGISTEEYNEMLVNQEGSCAICPTTEPGGKHNVFHVDHCHETGKVRGLLCKNCNIALGLVQDKPDVLGKMITYLITHQ